MSSSHDDMKYSVNSNDINLFKKSELFTLTRNGVTRRYSIA